MPTPPPPGPGQITISTRELFASADGGARLSRNPGVTVFIDGDASSVFSVFSLETFALRRDPELPHSLVDWESVSSVDGPGPISVGNGNFLLITVGCAFPPGTPPDTTFSARAVAVSEGTVSPALLQIPITATLLPPVPKIPTIAIEGAPTRALSGIAAGQPTDLKFRLTSSIDRDAHGLFSCNLHGSPFSSPPDLSVFVPAGGSVLVTVPVTCPVTTLPMLYQAISFDYVSDAGTFSINGLALEVVAERLAVRVLVVVDGVFRLGVPDPTDDFFSINAFLDILQLNETPVIEIDTAHRRGVDPKATIGGKFNFATSVADLSVYDVIWLLGYDGSNFGMSGTLTFISDSELQAIAQFMDGGGGVFATGDHDGLGSLMCGKILRVRSMRKWFAPSDDDPSIPADVIRNWPAFGAARADTLQPDHNGNWNFDNQSDDKPQPLSFPHGNDHPILQGPTGPLAFFPDHMHEGEVIEPIRLTDVATFNGQQFTEYRFLNGRQESPKVIATGAVIPGHATPREGSACEQRNFDPDMNLTVARTIGILCVYDGHNARVGRVVTDSSFHHYLDLNLIGDPCGVAEKQKGFTEVPFFQDMRAFFVNTVLWLAPKFGP